MAKYSTLSALFTAIANSIRGKTGGSGEIVADDFPAMIDGLDTSGITPTGTKSITTNGEHDVTSYAKANVNVPIPDGYIKPSGNKAITATTSTQTGIDVTNYATVSVAPTPSEAKSVTTNGDVTPSSGKLLSKVTVNVPTGEARDSSDITVSGATVNVPAGLYSSGASKSVASGTAGTPTASKSAVSNNSVTVTPSVTNTEGYITGGTETGTGVKVSASELVSGTKTITSNGTHDVTNYASAQIDVPVGVTPSGTKTITENGTHDVTNFASAFVNVPIPAQKIYTFPITVSSALGAGANKNQVILPGNDFVKAHYADDGFFAIWIPLNATTAAASGVAGMVYQGNRAVLTTKSTCYGGFFRSTGETANPGYMIATAKISGTGYNVSLRANSSGNINLYVASAYTVPAGGYLLVLGLAE